MDDYFPLSFEGPLPKAGGGTQRNSLLIWALTSLLLRSLLMSAFVRSYLYKKKSDYLSIKAPA